MMEVIFVIWIFCGLVTLGVTVYSLEDNDRDIFTYFVLSILIWPVAVGMWLAKRETKKPDASSEAPGE